MSAINRSRGCPRSTAFCILLCLFASPGFALECGDVLGPGGTFEMDADLQCDFPRGVPSLRLSGGVKLNMHDHTLSCLAHLDDGGDGDGIWLEGANDEVSGGTIDHCGSAVALRGDGGHRVSQLNVVGGNGDLLEILSNRNVVQDIVASEGSRAFVVSGDENIVMHNQSLSVGNDGFEVSGNRNRVIDNTATSSGCNNFRVTGADNLLTDNKALGNLIPACQANFFILGQSNILERNTARAGTRDGFYFGAFGGSSNNVLRDSVAIANAGSGIHVANGFTEGELVGNVATGNGQFDLRDDNPNCDNNFWHDNQFGTANALCISEICPSETRSVQILNSPSAPQPISSAVTTSGSAPSPPAEGGGAGAGGGGGGAIDWLTLLWLTGLAGMVAARGSAPGRRMDPDR
jgi:hypothetical protein